MSPGPKARSGVNEVVDGIWMSTVLFNAGGGAMMDIKRQGDRQ